MQHLCCERKKAGKLEYLVKGDGPEPGRQDLEAAGSLTGTGLIMAHNQEALSSAQD